MCVVCVEDMPTKCDIMNDHAVHQPLQTDIF